MACSRNEEEGDEIVTEAKAGKIDLKYLMLCYGIWNLESGLYRQWHGNQ